MRMNTLQRSSALVALAMLLSSVCAFAYCADPDTTQQGVLDARANLVVRTDRGNLQVHGSAGATQIHWSAQVHERGGQRHRPAEGQIIVRSNGDTVEIRSDGAADIDVTVPTKMTHVAVISGGGDVKLMDVATGANLVTEGGQIDVERVPGVVDARTGGGNITLRDSGQQGSPARLNTGGGNIKVDAAMGDVVASTGGGGIDVTAARGSVKASDGGGNVTVHQANGGVQLETAGGNVEMGDIGGDVLAKSGGGNIRLASARGMVKAETGAGGIDCRQMSGGLRADTAAGAIVAEFTRGVHFSDSKLMTGSGDVTVWLPNNVAAAIKATAENPWGHTIRTDFSAIRLLSTHGDGSLQAEGLMNGGGPLLRIQTGNGNVELLRLK
jgi:hypothetical protein